MTPTPYGADSRSPSPSFVCLLSPPDVGLIPVINIATGRQVLRGSENTFNPLSLPSEPSVVLNGNNIKITTLTGGNDAEGVYYCGATSNGQTTSVPVTILGQSSMLSMFSLFGNHSLKYLA